jgi:hypothetical protein
MADRGRDPRSRSPHEGGPPKKHKSKKEKKAEKEKQKAAARQLLETPDSEDSEDSQVDGSASAGTVALLPTDNTVLSLDFVNSLANSINDLTSAMKEVQVGMKAMQKDSQDQRSQIAVILGELQGMKATIAQNNAQHKDEMDKMNEDINTKIAQLRAAAPPIAVPVPGRASSSAGLAAPAASSGPLAPGTRRPTRLWLKGFKEVLTSRFLVDFAIAAVARLAPDLRTGAKPGAPGFGAVCYIDYPANTHMKPIRDAMVDLQLTHSDMEGNSHKIRISLDQSLEVRHKGRTLGELWKLVEPHLTGLPAEVRPKEYKLGNSNGKLFLIIGSRPLELFATHLDEQGTLHTTPNDKNLATIQVKEELAQAWITAAARSALRIRQ